MKAYNADYTWEEVKDAVNRCLQVIYKKQDGDFVEALFNNSLPMAMDKVAQECFYRGKHFYSFHDLHLIKLAGLQLFEVGYIGTLTIKDNRKKK